jgi:aspartate/methionine/tyrosine aminotransferase
MLDETGVATAPGRDFDPIHGDNWLRLSFAGSAEDIAEACGRLAAWLPGISDRQGNWPGLPS